MLEGSLNCLVLEKYVPKDYIEREGRLQLEVLASSPTMQQVQYTLNKPVLSWKDMQEWGKTQLLRKPLVLHTIELDLPKQVDWTRPLSW